MSSLTEKKGRRFCHLCQERGWRSRLNAPSGGWSTGRFTHSFYDEDGQYHHHDPNYTSSEWSCSQGHRWHEFHRHPCPAPECDFGKEEPSIKPADPLEPIPVLRQVGQEWVKEWSPSPAFLEANPDWVAPD